MKIPALQVFAIAMMADAAAGFFFKPTPIAGGKCIQFAPLWFLTGRQTCGGTTPPPVGNTGSGGPGGGGPTGTTPACPAPAPPPACPAPAAPPACPSPAAGPPCPAAADCDAVCRLPPGVEQAYEDLEDCKSIGGTGLWDQYGSFTCR